VARAVLGGGLTSQSSLSSASDSAP
jgi:hypothetical protein